MIAIAVDAAEVLLLPSDMPPEDNLAPRDK